MNNYKKLFWSNNYILIKNIFSKYEVKFISGSANAIWNNKNSNYCKYYENNNLWKIENFIHNNHGLKYFIKNRVETVVEKVYGNQVNLFKDKLESKLPEKNNLQIIQDYPEWKNFNSKFYLTVCLFPDNGTINDKCLELAEIKYLDKNYDHSFAQTKLKWKSIQSTSKDILIFNSYIPYKILEKDSEFNRKIIFLTYNDSDDGDFYNACINSKKNLSNETSYYNWSNPIII